MMMFGKHGALIPIGLAITFLFSMQLAVCQPMHLPMRFKPWWFVALMSAGLFRIGEASNPGPPVHFDASFDSSLFHIGTFNPSGLRGKAPYIDAHLPHGDLWTVSETHFFGRDLQSFRAGLKANRSPLRYCFSDACSMKPRLLSNTSWKGVAVLAKVPTRPIPAQIPQVVADSGRALVFTSLLHDAWVTGAVVYGEPDGHNYPNHKANTEFLLHHVASHVCNLSSGLRFISGDWNVECDSLPVFDLLAQAGFRDVQDIALSQWGSPVQKTCKQRTRKDFLFLSPELQALLQSVEITHDIWPDHAVLSASFHSPRSLPPQWKWPTPAAFPWPAEFGHEIVWDATPDPTSAYATLWQQIEQAACEQLPFPVARGLTGRAQTLKPSSHRRGSFAPIKNPRRGDFQHQYFGTSTKYAQWVRQVRRLQHFGRMVKAEQVSPGQLAEVWSSILRARGFAPSFAQWWVLCPFKSAHAPVVCPSCPPDPVTADAMFESVMMATRDFEILLKKQSRQYARFRREQNPNVIFQDIKPPAAPGVDILLQPIRAKVADVNVDDCSVTLDQECSFEADIPVCCRGMPLQIIHHDSDCLWLHSTDAIQPGDVVSQVRPIGSLQALAHEFTKVWKERWMRHADVPAGRWSVIVQFAKTHLPPGQFCWDGVEPAGLRCSVRSKRSRTSSGFDGVSRQDLLSMPTQVLQALCGVFHTAETDGVWPQQLVDGKVVSLAKVPQPSGALDFRPITIFGLLYRCWSTWHAKAALHSMESLLPDSLYGSRPGHYAAQVWARLLWAIEVSFVDQIALSGLVADLQKAFNVLPRLATFEMAAHLGIPGHVLVGWAAALSQMQRRFVIQGSLTAGVGSVTGFLEGCALSCIAMLIIDVAFHHWMSAFFPMCQAITYVDDWQVICSHPSFVAGAKACLDRFVQAVDLQLDNRKTFAWSIDAEGRKQLRQQGFDVKLGARNLGAHVQFSRKHTNATTQDRVQSVSALWPRLRLSACTYGAKLHAIKMAGWPRALHAISASTLGLAAFHSLRTGAMKALGVDDVGSNAFLHMGMVEDPMCDPHCWAIAQTLRFVRECGQREYIQQVLPTLVDGSQNMPANSITNTLLVRIQALGWRILPDGLLLDEIGPFSIFDCCVSELVLRVKWSWRKVVQREVLHRPGLQHVDFVDAADTRKWLSSLTPSDRALMRKCLNGTHITQDAKAHCQPDGSTLCPYCECTDSRFHRFWICERFASCRSALPLGFAALVPNLPETVTCHGWSLLPSTFFEWFRRLACTRVPDARMFGPCEHDLHFFTDGSCINQQEYGCRVSAWAVVLASVEGLQDSRVLDSGPLPGLLQSSYRAEIFAILRALTIASASRAKIFLWTDCKAVVKRLRRLLNGYPVKPNSKHSDLWDCIADILQNLNANQVVITRVAAHQHSDHATGPLQEWCFTNNGFADKAAVQAHHGRSREFWQFAAKHVAAFLAARNVSRAVQQVLLSISRAVVAEKENPEDIVADQLCEPTPVPAESWHPLSALSIPSQAVRWYGDENVRTLLSWYWGQVHSAEFPLIWVSQFHLYLDFQMAGEFGPIHLGRWQSGRSLPQSDLLGISFKVRARWFSRMLKESLKHQGSGFLYRFCRPHSRALALHTGCLGVPWNPERISLIDDWLLQFFPGGLRRISKGLDTLPPALKDDRFTEVWLSTA